MPEDSGKRRSTRDDEEGHTGYRGIRMGEPPEAVRDLGTGQGQQSEGEMDK